MQISWEFRQPQDPKSSLSAFEQDCTAAIWWHIAARTWMNMDHTSRLLELPVCKMQDHFNNLE